MRTDRSNSISGDGNHARSGASTKAASSGHGTTVTGGTGISNGPTKEDQIWFEQIKEEVEEISDCPGGICPVPWATNTNDDDSKECPVLTDNVNHPSHYTDGGIECIEAIEAQLTPEEYRGYLRGNCAKYLWRCNMKGATKQDLEKCQWYLNRLLTTFDD